jgi:hypothetical protein
MNTHPVRRLIRKVVKGKILEIRDMGNGEYLVWTKYIIDGDDDTEIWDIYYRIKVYGNKVEVLDEDWE